MTKRMLIDATHSEETRVAVVDGNRLVDFDYESALRKQLKGSIFLAKVTRVEPSLQAAFVNFGGNRHGFLPFTEIHPDYYRIPIADREAILAEQEKEMEERLAEEEAEDEHEENSDDDHDDDDDEVEAEAAGDDDHDDDESEADVEAATAEDDVDGNVVEEEDDIDGNVAGDEEAKESRRNRRGRGGRHNNRGGKGRGRRGGRRMASSNRKVEIVGGDGIEGDQPLRPSLRRHYKIQEVVKRGQIMLIQVSKEERGNKGAAVSTYLSLPGRYCVLMPNSPRAGGVSRKIANYKERRRMREILNELKLPQGMSVIMRTAGTSRTKTEIKRDLDYLLRLWDNIRELTLESTAPALIHEEGNLIRRSIRDIYTSDIEEVLVAGTDGYKFAKDFMKMMIPSHAKRVKEYKDEQIPLFHRYQVESQISEIGEPVVTLPSGGYLVINPTEALVSIDVNSGKATKERHIEETALRTNLESAEEVARQMRLRDLGGLVVIDFIDMEDRRNNRKVENRLKEALSNDRARIQIGRISSFGLLELSRQRLNPSLTEAQHEKCSHCQGVGNVRTVDATAITALRALEEEGIRGRSDDVVLHISNTVALFILNNKRDMLGEIESRYGFKVTIKVNDDLSQSHFVVEPVKTAGGGGNEEADEDESAAKGKDEDSGQQKRGRRRRGGRGGRRRGGRNKDFEDRDDSGKPVKDEAAEDKKSGDKEDRPTRGSSRKAARKSRKKETSKDDGKDSAKEAAEDKKVEKKAAKSRKTPSRKKKAKADEKKQDKKDSAAEANVSEVVQPSNDTGAPAAKDYETVNEPPTKKKKGWWNKLSD